MAAPHHDPEGEDDLAGVDLAQLDLDGIDLGERPDASSRLLALALLVALGALVLWLPSTQWFVHAGADSGWSFALSGAAIIIGILLGRWLWRWAQSAALRRERVRADAGDVAKPPSALRRWAVLLAAAGATAAILYVPATAYYDNGVRYQSTWFIAALGAVAVGILAGRWLLMQAAARRAGKTERRAVPPPPWLKWATLAAILAAALVVLVGKVASGGSEPGAFQFGLGAVGFIAGVGGALWIARRFDEWERSYGEERRPRARGGPPTRPRSSS